MLNHARALETLDGEQLDVVVIGGGITGAGALDAASRGYSVALVEKAVREALLERQLMVKLAPHLVKPLALVAPAFDGARPDRLVGIGLNMYDVMATPRLRGRRNARRAAGGSGEALEADWSPARHRVISGEEVA